MLTQKLVSRIWSQVILEREANKIPMGDKELSSESQSLTIKDAFYRERSILYNNLDELTEINKMFKTII